MEDEMVDPTLSSHDGPKTEQSEASEQVVFDTEHHTFENLDSMHPLTKESLARQGIANMTEIQYKTWHAAVQGRDVIARSRTGSGKTLAFLLPALERILQDPQKLGSGQVRILIVSPTRELAHQISEAARKITAKHDRRLTSHVLYGGVPKHKDLYQLCKTRPTILTATPGRLLDHLESSILEVEGGVPFEDTVKDVDILVLDEMDRCVIVTFDSVFFVCFFIICGTFQPNCCIISIQQ